MKILDRYRQAIRAIWPALMWLYVHIRSPWIKARFFAAWPEYQQGPVYRERLLYLGFFQAYDRFSKWEQNYCLKLRRQKEPWLRWKILFAPYSFTVPEDLQIAVRQGYFDKDSAKA